MNEAGCQEEHWRPDMIEGLDDLLKDSGQPGLVELRQLLGEMFSKPAAVGQVLERRKLPSRRPRVYRLRFGFDGWVRSVVAKRMELDNARRNQLAIRRWLPAVGLGDNGPTLLGVAAERYGQWVWHVYDDFGDRVLETSQPDPENVRAAVDIVAQAHTRFAGHVLLAECRLLGSDFGISF